MVAPRAGQLSRRAALVGMVVYLVGISVYLLAHGGWPTPDYLVPPLLLLAIARGRGWPFVADWGPFLLLVLSWQATAGIADQFGRPVHVRGPIDSDQWLFRGETPTVWLQDRLYDPARARWYDWAGTAQHALHFVLPVVVGWLIWQHSRRVYWRYLLSLMTLFYIGFAGYVLYPAAPPWMAGLQEAIPEVRRVAVETVLRLPASAPVGLAYTHFSANQVAAMPSLHAGVPLLLALVAVRLWGRRALPALLYPLTMGYNLVYLGEHYVVDVLAGYAVALVAYGLVWALPDMLRLRVRVEVSRDRPGRLGPPAAVAANAAAGFVPAAGGHRVSRLAGNGALWAIAVASVAVILGTLRPGRPLDHGGPVVPGLQVEAGQITTLLAPTPCESGASPSLTLSNMLGPVAGRYSVYLFDLDSVACYSVDAGVSFPPPRLERVAELAARAPVRLAPVSPAAQMRRGVEYYALRAGAPAVALVEAGLPADHRYLMVFGLSEIADPSLAATTIDEIAALTLIEDPLSIEGALPPSPPAMAVSTTEPAGVDNPSAPTVAPPDTDGDER